MRWKISLSLAREAFRVSSMQGKTAVNRARAEDEQKIVQKASGCGCICFETAEVWIIQFFYFFVLWMIENVSMSCTI